MTNRKPAAVPRTRSLYGFHLTLCGWLPPPAGDWPGWVRCTPYEFLVHPLARPALVARLTEAAAAAGCELQIHEPPQTEAASKSAVSAAFPAAGRRRT